jgi:hypothetical protein
LAAVLATAAPFAQASLTAYSSDGKALVGVGTGPSPSTYDFTMTASGNLLSSSTLRSAILAANSSLNSGDFDSFGRATYRGALAFISYLNSTSYGGTQQWHLPALLNTATCDLTNFTYSGTNCGYNVNTANSEMARVYYTELGRIAKFDADGFTNGGYGIFNNDGAQTSSVPVPPFSNVQSDAYWLGLTYNDAQAWSFATSDGVQGNVSKAGLGFAWAVAPGNVQITTSPVPLPAPVWLIGSGLACLAFRLRRARPA